MGEGGFPEGILAVSGKITLASPLFFWKFKATKEEPCYWLPPKPPGDARKIELNYIYMYAQKVIQERGIFARIGLRDQKLEGAILSQTAEFIIATKENTDYLFQNFGLTSSLNTHSQTKGTDRTGTAPRRNWRTLVLPKWHQHAIEPNPILFWKFFPKDHLRFIGKFCTHIT